MFEKGFEKARETSETGSIFESCWITDHDLLKVVKFNGNLKKMLIAVLPERYGRKSAFQQSQLNYINSQNQNQKRTHHISNGLY